MALARLPDGESIYRLAARIYPIARSLTGPGVEQTLRILAEYVPDLCIHRVRPEQG